MPSTPQRLAGRWLEPGIMRVWVDPLAGPNAMTVPGFVIACIAIQFGIAGSAPGGDTVALLTTEVIGLGSCAITAIAWVAASLTYMRVLQGTQRAAAALATFAFVGAARSLYQDTVLFHAGIAAPADFVWLIPFTMLTTVVWSTIGAIIVDAWRDSTTAYALLSRERAWHAFLKHDAEEMLAARHRQVVHELEAVLDAELEATLSGDADRVAAAERLRTIARAVVRPVSQALANRPVVDEILGHGDDIPSTPRARLSPPDVRVLAGNAFMPFYTAILVVVVSFTEATETVGLGPAVPSTLAGVLVLVVGLGIARRLAQHGLTRARTAIQVLVIAATWLGVSVLDFNARAGVVIAMGVDADTTQEYLLAKTVVADVLVMLVIAVAVSVVRRVRERTATLTQEIADTQHTIGRLLQVAWADQRQLATFIHGDVQARLIAAAMRLSVEPAADADAILGELASKLAERFATGWHGEPWRTALDTIANTWRDAALIDVKVDRAAAAALDADATAAYATVEVIRELVTNGIQHGDATSFRITVTRNGSHLAVVVLSDGRLGTPLAGGSMPSLATALLHTPRSIPSNPARLPEPDPATLTRSGLGLRVLDRACLAWWLRPSRTGCKAGALIPLDTDGPATHSGPSVERGLPDIYDIA